MSCFADMSQPETVAAALRKYRVKGLFVSMPQALTSGDMAACSEAVCQAVAGIPGGVKVVRLSSYAIEPSEAAPRGQGALGAAHLSAEEALRQAGVPFV